MWFSGDGGRGSLASSGLEVAPVCPTIHVHLDKAGLYLLEVQKVNSADAGTVQAGDFYLRMSLASDAPDAGPTGN